MPEVSIDAEMPESGADEGLAVLFRERYGPTVRLAFVMTSDAQLAEDLAQEAFVRTWRAWGRIRDPEAAAGYVRATVMNLARSSLRRRLVEAKYRLRREPDREPDESTLRIDLIRALQDLPPRQRACIALRYLDDLSEEDTARALGVSVGTVKSQTHKGLKRLGTILDGDDDDA